MGQDARNGRKVVQQQMKEIVFMTGAPGFIGRYTVDILLKKGYALRCLVRESSDVAFLKDKNDVQLVYGDITKPETLKNQTDGCAYVLHLAAEGHVSAMSEEAFQRFVAINEGGTHNMIEACKTNDALKKFVHFSSTAAMGPIGDPILNEESQPVPVTPYQKSKYKSEQVVMAAAHNGFPGLIARPCMVYGVGGTGAFHTYYRLMTRGKFPRVGKGENLTPMVYVSDVAAGGVAAMERGRPGEVYLLTGAQSYPIDDVRNAIVKYAGVAAKYPHVPKGLALAGVKLLEKFYTMRGKDPIATYENIKSSTTDRTFDITKAITELGYEPKVGLEEGAKLTVEWYKSQGL